MSRKTVIMILFLCSTFNVQLSFAQCSINLLNNPGFDAPVQSAIGNNLTGLFTFNGWTVTGGPFNVIKTNGSAYGGGPDNAKDGNQYIDITSAAGTLYQDFVITGSATPVGYSGFFSSREQSGSYTNWTASIQIINLATSTVVSTSTTKSFTNADGAVPAQETWYYVYGNTTLPPGNYRYLANIGDFGNFDAAQLSTSCILAARVVSFTGSYAAGKATLRWQTDPSSSVSSFEVEQSSDGRNFTSIGTVAFLGNQAYDFTDNSASASGINYYRLKMTDANGRVSYSNTISVKTKGILSLQVTPNPVSDMLQVNGLNGKGQVSILDAAGRTLLQQQVTGTQTVSIDVSALGKGIYLLVYFDGTVSSVQKFSKQ